MPVTLTLAELRSSIAFLPELVSFSATVFDDPAALDGIERDDRLRLHGLRAALAAGRGVTVENTRTGARFTTSCVLTPRERDILLAGGILAHTKGKA